MRDTRSGKDMLEPPASPKEKEAKMETDPIESNLKDDWNRLIQKEDEDWVFDEVLTELKPWFEISAKFAEFMNYATLMLASLQKATPKTEEGKKKIQLYIERRINPILRLKGDIDALIASKATDILKELEERHADQS